MIEEILYISTATQRLEASRLPEAAAAWARQNEARGVSGFLIFNGVNFIQLLEGSPDAVERTYLQLYLDQRHTGIIELRRRQGTLRRFPDWPLAWRNVSTSSEERSAGSLGPGVLEARLHEQDDRMVVDVLASLRGLIGR